MNKKTLKSRLRALKRKDGAADEARRGCTSRAPKASTATAANPGTILIKARV
ncbi:MAG: hypothetical protein U0670_22360 [Anaerolineae bacterium]